MKTITIFTNGKILFTLEDYCPAAGVCHSLGITQYRKVDESIKNKMHASNELYYIKGTGNRKEISNKELYKGIVLDNFTVN